MPLNINERRILLVGTFLSETRGTKGISETLATLLSERVWQVELTSSQINRGVRLLDMVWKTWSLREDCNLAHIDIFSGTAFIWAEIISYLLYALKNLSS